MFLGTQVEAGEIRLERNLLAALLVTFHHAEGQTEREGGIGISVGSLDGIFRAGDLRVGLAFDFFDVGLHGLADGPGRRVHQPGQGNHRIARSVGRFRAAFVELFAHGDVLELGALD